jgi:hypothetical protein
MVLSVLIEEVYEDFVKTRYLIDLLNTPIECKLFMM